MISKSQITFIKSLQHKKHRVAERQFVIEGEKLIHEFIHSKFNIRTIYTTDNHYLYYEQLCSKVSKKIEIVCTKYDVIERMSSLVNASESLAIVDMPDDGVKIDYNEWIERDSLVLLLDEIRDPGNMGSIIRIADWFGIHQIVCSEQCVDLYNPKVVQSTMGSITRTQVEYRNLSDLIQEYKGIPVYGALLDGINIYDNAEQMKGFVLMGSESHGISQDLRAMVSHPVMIPRYGEAESLNVSIATAVLCAEARRRG